MIAFAIDSSPLPGSTTEVSRSRRCPRGRRRRPAVLPGFGVSAAITSIVVFSLIVFPLAVLVLRAASLGPGGFLAAAWTPRARAAYAVSLGASLIAAVLSSALGLVVAWVLARFRFPGRRLLDALVDVPLALPTAVAGLVYSTLYVPKGWLGQWLVPLGIKGAYSFLGIVLVLVFVSLPFAVRVVQPVIESLDRDTEEAARILGASRLQTFLRVVLPGILPAFVTGFALSLARALGEYGSVVFISGNMPFKTEIAPVLIVSRLEEFAYAEATTVAVLLLAMSLALLVVVNTLQQRLARNAQ
ncbi:MAG: sulfate ABC transporter permease subunit CysT [Planctomycetes bacterium]|nr:sulfate ABC transporter permease subunit CysT [Planctomycetota bacterium]